MIKNNISFDGRVLIVENYLSIENLKELREWAISSKDSQFSDGVGRDSSGSPVRVKSRVSNRASKNINYPSLVYDIQSLIRKDFGLEKAELIEGHGKDGVVVSITYENGDVFKHRDPKMDIYKSCLRLNILASNADVGGLIHVEDKVYNPKAGDLMAYLVSDYEHSVETCLGQTPRIQFMFGFFVYKQEWESGIYVNNYKLNN